MLHQTTMGLQDYAGEWLSFYGVTGELGQWREVADLFKKDELAAAAAKVVNLGAGLNIGHLLVLKMLEAESATRSMATILNPKPWLQIEYVPEEVSLDHAALAESVVAAFDKVSLEFGFEQGAPTMVSFLTESTDAPWMPGPFGYVVEKKPYDKICVASHLTGDFVTLERVLIHEYAHVIANESSDGRLQPWEREVFAMMACRAIDPSVIKGFADGATEWLKADDFRASFNPERDLEADRAKSWGAYQQASVLGSHLLESYGAEGLVKWLKAHAEGSMFTELMRRVVPGDLPSKALDEVFGKNLQGLLDDAQKHLSKLAKTVDTA